MFVVKQISVIKIRTLDLGGGRFSDSADVGGERFRIAPL